MAAILVILLAFSELAAAQTLTIPSRSGPIISLTSPQRISGSKDFGNQEYDRGLICETDVEVQNSEVFILEDGASISNVIIGTRIKEGIVCRGACTLTNVWFRNACESAITAVGSGDILIQGGGAQSAPSSVVQHNGVGTVTIRDYTVVDVWNLYKSCGSCKNNAGPRNVIVSGVKAGNVRSDLVGINSNFGDVATIDETCGVSRKPCQEYKGVGSGLEAPKVSTTANCRGTQGKLAALPACRV